MAQNFIDYTRVSPTEQDSTFVNVHQPWSWFHTGAVAGSLVMAQALSAAHNTLPSGWRLDNVHTEFLKPTLKESPILHEVQQTSTSRNTAVRQVTVKQASTIKALIIFSFAPTAPEIEKPQPFENIPTPKPHTIKAASHIIDPEANDWSEKNRIVTGEGYVSAQRLGFAPVSNPLDAIYHAKLKVNTPLTTPEEQMTALVFFSDLYVLDAALVVTGFTFAPPAPGQPRVRSLLTLNQTVHVHRGSGWDANRGVLLEMRLRWAKGRRALIHADLLDCEGVLIASVVQEGHFVFQEAVKQEKL